MTTRITVNVSGNRLLKQARENQLANRQTLTQKESDDKFLADTRQFEASAAAQAAARQREGAVPEYNLREQTSAQRGGIFVAGVKVNYQPEITNVKAESLKLTTMAGAGGYPKYTKFPTPGVPNTVLEYFPPQMPTYTFPSNPYGDLVGAGQANYYSEDGSYYDTIFYATLVSTGRRFLYFLLPAGEKNIMVVTVAKRVAVGTRRFMRVRTTTPPYPQPSTSSILEDETIQPGVEKVSAYKAFIVSPKSIREVTAPQALVDKLDLHLPDMDANDTATQSANKDLLGNGYDAFTYPIFNGTKYDNEALYGTTPELTKLFARSYGLGLYTTEDFPTHVGPGLYTTPSIYQYLNGTLSLTSSSITSYEQMSTLLNLSAYSRTHITLDFVLASDYVPGSPVYIGSLKDSRSADIPSSLYTKIAKSAFRKIKADVPVRANDEVFSFSDFSYAWDWNNKRYCQQQLLNLGFTAADLKP